MKLLSLKTLIEKEQLFPKPMLATLLEYFPKDYAFSQFIQNLISPPSITSIRVNSALLLAENKSQNFISTLFEDLFSNKWTFEKDPVLDDCYTIPVLKTELYEQQMDEKFLRKYNYKMIIVDYRCANSILRGAPIFAAGVLASSKCISKMDSVLVFCDWNSQCTRGEKIQIENSWTQLSAFKEENPFIFLGVGEVSMERSEIFQQNAKGIAVEMKHPIFETVPLHNLPNYLFAQNISSIFIGHLMHVKSDSKILDCCAAPGGKTGHLLNNLLKEIIMKAQTESKDFKDCIAQSQSKIIAIDRQKSKVELMKSSLWNQFHSLLELNENLLECKALDSSKLSAHFKPNQFDRILCDVPCTGTGLRPNLQPPSLHPCQSIESLQLQSDYQFKIVKAAIPLLQVGGILIYSTCSIMPHENEMQVKRILEQFGDKLELMELPKELHSIAHYFTTGLISVLQEKEAKKCLRFDFVHCDQTIGFFACRFQKKSKKEKNNDHSK